MTIRVKLPAKKSKQFFFPMSFEFTFHNKDRWVPPMVNIFTSQLEAALQHSAPFLVKVPTTGVVLQKQTDCKILFCSVTMATKARLSIRATAIAEQQFQNESYSKFTQQRGLQRHLNAY